MIPKRPIETCHLDAGWGWKKYARDEFNYFHEHLTTLYFILKLSNAMTVLEIGAGPSTVVITNALTEMSGDRILESVDINEHAWDKVQKDLFLNVMEKFVKDSLDFNPTYNYDVMLIDGDHAQGQVSAEIHRFLQRLKLGGYMLFHDITNPKWGKGVKKAIFDSELMSPDYDAYEWLNCNGLAVFKKVR